MKKKQSVAKIILIYFFKTIGILALLVGVGVLSYYLTMLYFKQTDQQERSTTYTHVISVSAGTESSNLIYSYGENDGQIKKLVDFIISPEMMSLGNSDNLNQNNIQNHKTR